MKESQIAPQAPVREELLPVAEIIRMQHESPLVASMHAEGIPPLNKQSCKRYMDQRVHELKYPKEIIRVVQNTNVILIAASIAIFLVAAFMGATNQFDTFQMPLGLTMCLAIVGIIYGIHGRHEVEKYIPFAKSLAAWESLPYKDYLEKQSMLALGQNHAPIVPPEIKNLVKKAQAEIPHLKVWVDYLHTDPLIRFVQTPPRGRSDEQYAACWDENGLIV